MLGKVFTMAYSVVGIPLALIMFQVLFSTDLPPCNPALNTNINNPKTFPAIFATVLSSLLQSIGERMNKCSSIIIQKLRTWFGCRQKEATELDLIFSSLFFSFISISGGTILYSTQEGWTYFESCYYCFITLTTIGFGDFVALQQQRSLTLRPGYVVAR